MLAVENLLYSLQKLFSAPSDILKDCPVILEDTTALDVHTFVVSPTELQDSIAWDVLADNPEATIDLPVNAQPAILIPLPVTSVLPLVPLQKIVLTGSNVKKFRLFVITPEEGTIELSPPNGDVAFDASEGPTILENPVLAEALKIEPITTTDGAPIFHLRPEVCACTKRNTKTTTASPTTTSGNFNCVI